MASHGHKCTLIKIYPNLLLFHAPNNKNERTPLLFRRAAVDNFIFSDCEALLAKSCRFRIGSEEKGMVKEWLCLKVAQSTDF
jgi:hypothetical protein